MLTTLAHVLDPRDPRGVRYSLAGLLAVAVCAVVAGAKSFAPIGEFPADLDAVHLGRFGLDKAPGGVHAAQTVRPARRGGAGRPRSSGLGTWLAALTAWVWCRVRTAGGRRVIEIDGKTIRGASSAATSAPHLIAALDHATGVVLGRQQVDAKSNEIPAVWDLLDA